MKIRCEHNSIRYRLRKSEIAQLRAEGCVRTSAQFPGGVVLAWELLVDNQAQAVHGRFADGVVQVVLPTEVAAHWMDSNDVSVEYFQSLDGSGNTLHLLVEKDFPCKDRPWEDGTEFFAELRGEEGPVC